MLPEKLNNVHEEVESVPSIAKDDHIAEDMNGPGVSDEPQLFTQLKLCDLVSKDLAVLLCSRLKELASGTAFSWFLNREINFDPFFLMKVS